MGLSRLGLWSEISSVSIVEPMLRTAYQRQARREWYGEEGRDTTSFYLSSFPGDMKDACGRAAIYALMNVPPEKPIDPEGRVRMDAGKNNEMEFVRRLASDGVLLSGDETAGEAQTKFEDPEVWASGAVDAIILPHGWRKGHCVELKQTAHEKVLAMRERDGDTPYSHPKYVRQLLAYIGYAYEQKFAPKVILCEESWAVTKEAPLGLRWCPVHHRFDCKVKSVQLIPPDDGTLIYSSRDEPLLTVSFYFTLDLDILAAGKEKLYQWRKAFEQDILPSHPHMLSGKKWSVEPCRYCPWKKYICKPDFEARVQAVSASNAIAFGETNRPGYDYNAVRAKVFARWGVPDPLENGHPA